MVVALLLDLLVCLADDSDEHVQNHEALDELIDHKVGGASLGVDLGQLLKIEIAEGRAEEGDEGMRHGAESGVAVAEKQRALDGEARRDEKYDEKKHDQLAAGGGQRVPQNHDV